MNAKSLGIGLIIIGILMTIYTGFNYVTTEKMVDIGPIKINKEKNHPVQWTPIVGVVIFLAGGLIIIKIAGKKE